MVRDIQATSADAARIKRQIEALVAEARRAEAERGAGGASERIRATVTYALEVKFRDVMRDFAELRAELQRDHLAVVSRRYAAVVGHPPEEEELRQLAGDAPQEAAERVFADAMRSQGRALEGAAARAGLAEVQERHDAIAELEKGLTQLHQMFLDMATLVDQQGDVIDSIESQVAKSTDYVARGQQALAQARRHQRSARAKKAAVLLAVVALIAVIAAAIAIPSAVHAGRR